MNARLVYDLVRMGLAVGAHLEHPVDARQIEGLSRDLAKPVIEALEPTVDDAAGRAWAACWHSWDKDTAGAGIGPCCPGGCHCVLDRDVVHGAARGNDDFSQAPHVCRRGHTWRLIL